MTGGIHFVLSVVVISVVARKTSHNMMSSGTAVPHCAERDRGGRERYARRSLSAEGRARERGRTTREHVFGSVRAAGKGMATKMP